MRLARFSTATRGARLGLVVDGAVIDLKEDLGEITDMRALIEQFDALRPALQSAAEGGPITRWMPSRCTRPSPVPAKFWRWD